MRAGLKFFDLLDYVAHGLAEFHFGRMQHGLLELRVEAFVGKQLENVEAAEIPAVTVRDRDQLGTRFRERNVQTCLALLNAFE